MRNLFLFLKRNLFLVLFVLLQMISLLLLFNSYSYHKSLAFNTVSDFSGSVFASIDGIVDYFNLKTENIALVEENARLNTYLSASLNTADTAQPDGDTIYQYKSANVVSNTVNRRNNFITIDKGRLDGVEKEMGVLSGNGIAGIVIGVSDHYALIMSLLHQNAVISARIKKNNQLVNVAWNTRDYLVGTVIDIPAHIQLDEGDTIVSSGNSLIFPKDIPIGTIISHQKSANKGLEEALFTFSTDFNSLGHVYIIFNRHKQEQLELINTEVSANE